MFQCQKKIILTTFLINLRVKVNSVFIGPGSIQTSYLPTFIASLVCVVVKCGPAMETQQGMSGLK